MKPPMLLLRMVPGRRCMRCGASTYVHDKTGLCCGCLDISLKLYENWKRKQGYNARQGKSIKGGT